MQLSSFLAFSTFLTVALTLTAHASEPVSRQDSSKGAIAVPAPGTPITPGSPFDFQYNPRADYGISTYYLHVFLLDQSATVSTVGFPVMTPIDVFSTGYYFGRFDYANYPAIPYPQNPLPSLLTMPDFSKAPGGFGTGTSASDVKMQLVVVEEYADGSPVGLGHKLGLVMTGIVYNATLST